MYKEFFYSGRTFFSNVDMINYFSNWQKPLKKQVKIVFYLEKNVPNPSYIKINTVECQQNVKTLFST